jgi:3,4-dihydroxy 2-butanone 4-phosphate synthase / GTP cyclohydrolase II
MPLQDRSYRLPCDLHFSVGLVYHTGGIRIGRLMWAAIISEQKVSTRRGQFNARVYRGEDRSVGAALWQGNLTDESQVLCRVHSSCFTSEALGAVDCDCVEQLDMALQAIASRQCGVIFYLLQEGRGAGLLSKARDRMVVQTSGGAIDTFAAYEQLGIEPDPRRYELAAAMCADLDIGSLQLMTNNPAKISSLTDAGLSVEAIPHASAPSPYNSQYLAAKARSGHIFDAPTMDIAAPPGLEAADPQVGHFGSFLRIASYDVPIGTRGEPVWFRATAYSDAVGSHERLILSHPRRSRSAPVLQIFRDQLFERLAGGGESARQYHAAVRRIAERGTGSILAIPDDPSWLATTSGPTVDEELELLRSHAQVIR